MNRRKISLDDDHKRELLRLRDYAPKPYLRERAAAILKVADGIAGAVVARDRLLKARRAETVYRWLKRYEKEGIPGLSIKPGRGRKPAFPPNLQRQPEQAKTTILETIHRAPQQFGLERTRWTLKNILDACSWIRVKSLPGLWQILDRLDIVWKRGREHLFSPDPDYVAKLQYIEQLKRQVRASDGELALLYLDEFTLHRQPTVANAYELKGHHQPLAERSLRADTLSRIVATLDVLDGRVVYRRASKITGEELVRFYEKVCDSYPRVERIYVAQDNWPLHSHPDVLAALEQQEAKWPWHRPPDWGEEPSRRALRQYAQLRLPIQIVTLPTYAPWSNPIEKLWRKLKQELLHLHRLADHLEELRRLVDAFLDGFASGSLDLLRYVGLQTRD